jgi:hypothetical protein
MIPSIKWDFFGFGLLNRIDEFVRLDYAVLLVFFCDGQVLVAFPVSLLNM